MHSIQKTLKKPSQAQKQKGNLDISGMNTLSNTPGLSSASQFHLYLSCFYAQQATSSLGLTPLFTLVNLNENKVRIYI